MPAASTHDFPVCPPQAVQVRSLPNGRELWRTRACRPERWHYRENRCNCRIAERFRFEDFVSVRQWRVDPVAEPPPRQSRPPQVPIRYMDTPIVLADVVDAVSPRLTWNVYRDYFNGPPPAPEPRTGTEIAQRAWRTVDDYAARMQEEMIRSLRLSPSVYERYAMKPRKRKWREVTPMPLPGD
jgi:hypothetical protein